MISPVQKLAEELIQRKSVTPLDDGCQEILASRLSRLGFENTHLRYEDVDNLWSRLGSGPPLFVFAGHTDVVPPGPLNLWYSDPFEPTIRDGMLFGRGAADMKSSIAAMVVAAERFVSSRKQPKGSIAFLITSDEEGTAKNGTAKVIEHLRNHSEHIDFCLIGEPSSSNTLGDSIRVGRRGSLTGRLTLVGTQGHVAYPQATPNPIHEVIERLSAITRHHWDEGDDYFPPTTFQISNLNAGTEVSNVIPGVLEMTFNFRFNTEQTIDSLRQVMERAMDGLEPTLKVTFEWSTLSLPFLSNQGKLTESVRSAIRAVRACDTKLSTSGGTSDGRFIVPTGAEVVELGPVNTSIHKVNECVRVSDLEPLAEIYFQTLASLIT